MLLFRGALPSQKWSKASSGGSRQKYECADLPTIPVTLTTHNAAKIKVQIQQQIQIQVQFLSKYTKMRRKRNMNAVHIFCGDLMAFPVTPTTQKTPKKSTMEKYSGKLKRTICRKHLKSLFQKLR